MTTYSTTIAPTQATDAEFRTLVAAIIAGIDAVITRTSDTGQINTATVNRPGVNNTGSGYAMWRITGGTQAVYMRMDFGQGVGNTTPSFWIQFGTATNGAGTLSGATTTQRQQVMAASVTAMACYFSGGTGRFACALFDDNAAQDTQRFTLSMERDWNADGTVNEAYYYVVWKGNANNSTHWHRCVKVSGDQWHEMSTMVGTWPVEASTHVLGLDIASYPVRPNYGTERNPSRNWIIIGATDVAAATIFNADMYAVAHTWIRIRSFPNAGTFRDGNHVMCMRYE